MHELVDKILPAYPFIQYRDDENIVAFFDAYNELAQEYLTVFNKLNLGFWPSEIINAEFLDWIALGIYGVKRERIIEIDYPPPQKIEEDPIQADEFKTAGVYDSIEYNVIAYNEFKEKATLTTEYMSDDFFRRILLWNFFKDDRFQFSIPWLKNRIARFFKAKRSDPFNTEDCYNLSYYSVQVNKGTFTITIDKQAYTDSEGEHEDLFKFFKLCAETRIINIPFQYTYIVNKKS